MTDVEAIAKGRCSDGKLRCHAPGQWWHGLSADDPGFAYRGMERMTRAHLERTAHD